MTTHVATLPMSISNAYLLQGERPVLIDAGGQGDEERLRTALFERGVKPEDLALVVVTHGHTDHTGALSMLARAGVPIAVGEGDEKLLAEGRNGVLPATGLAGVLLMPLVRRMKVTPSKPDVIVRETLDLTRYGVDGVVTRSGGHTPGSVTVRSGTDVLVGDLVRGTRKHPERPVRHYYAEDPAAVRRVLASQLASDAVRLLPGHGDRSRLRTSVAVSARSPPPDAASTAAESRFNPFAATPSSP